MWLILIILAIGFIFWFIYQLDSMNNRKNNNIRPIIQDESYLQKSKPKISAEVNDILYKEIQSYCTKNSISTSELIRRSVRDYMDNH